jgi:hypothetical protein
MTFPLKTAVETLTPCPASNTIPDVFPEDKSERVSEFIPWIARD